MKARSLLLSVATLLFLGAIRSHATDPLLEYKFNAHEDEMVESSGINPLALSLSGATISPDGVSGKSGDSSLDNTNGDGADGKAISQQAFFLYPLKSFTLLGWIKDTQSQTDLQGRVFCWRSPKGGIDFGMERNIFFLNIGGEDGGRALLPLGKKFPDLGSERWIFFAVVWNGEDGLVRFFLGTDKDNLEEWASTSTDLKTIGSGDTLLAIGNASGGTRPLCAKLDNIRFFVSDSDGSGALSEDLIKGYLAKDMR